MMPTVLQAVNTECIEGEKKGEDPMRLWYNSKYETCPS